MHLLLCVFLVVLSVVFAYPELTAPPTDADYYAGQGGKGTDFSTNLYEFKSGTMGFIPTEGHRPPCQAGEVSLVSGGPCYGPVTSGTRDIQYIAVHTTASPGTPDSIMNYWRTSLGWKDPGYHFLIGNSFGEIYNLHPTTKDSNGVKGMNPLCVNLSWIGGKYTDNRTDEQKASLRRLVKRMKANFPNATIQGHRDFPGVTKPCPRFDAGAEFADIFEEDKALAAHWAKLDSASPPSGNGNTDVSNDNNANAASNTTEGLFGIKALTPSILCFGIAGIALIAALLLSNQEKPGMGGGVPGGYMPMNTQMGGMNTQMGGMNTQMGGMNTQMPGQMGMN